MTGTIARDEASQGGWAISGLALPGLAMLSALGLASAGGVDLWHWAPGFEVAG